VLKLDSDQEKIRAVVIEYVKEAYRASVNTRVPSLRGQICKHVEDEFGITCYPDKLQSCFPPELDGPGPLMKRICTASDVPYPSERVRLAKRALGGRKKRAAASEVRDGPGQGNHLESIRRSYDIEKAQQAYRMERARMLAEEIRMLVSDPLKEVREPVLETIAEKLPEITRIGWHVSVDLPTLINTNKELRRMRKEGVDDSPKILGRWRRLSHTGRKAFRDLCEEAEAEGMDANKYVLDLRRRKKSLLGGVKVLERREKQLQERILQSEETKMIETREHVRRTDENKYLRSEIEKLNRQKHALEAELSRLVNAINVGKKELAGLETRFIDRANFMKDTIKKYAEARNISLSEAEKAILEIIHSPNPNLKELEKDLATIAGRHD